MNDSHMIDPLPSSHSLKVSVALCTYNGARYIFAQIESIFKQTLPPDEIIICDDGSNDGTPEIIGDIIGAPRDIDIQLIKNDINLGYVRNFEKAVGLCTGDVIFLSDQDDIWFPERIELMVKPFAENNDIGLYTAMRRLWTNDSTRLISRFRHPHQRTAQGGAEQKNRGSGAQS